MRAMQLSKRDGTLALVDIPIPVAGPTQVLVRVSVCGVCRTDLHVVDGDLPDVPDAIIPGHEIVGTVAALGAEVRGLEIGDRVGVPWLGATCGQCRFCQSHRENLCEAARFTGYTLNGGYAEYAVAEARFTFKLPARYDDATAAPLLCAGLIGYRSLSMAGDARRIGLYGFGAAAHLIAQIAQAQSREVYAFTRPGDEAAMAFALANGACWAGASDAPAPRCLDAAILFAPVGDLVPQALAAVDRGGTVVCAGIHMSDIPAFPYRLIWGERQVRSVANLTRDDGLAFLALAERIPLHVTTKIYPLEQANVALSDLRSGAFSGAAVLQIRAP
ncbi:zinc-dependent alcohol dehydrogenase family protein [Pandoraea sp. XJJ-1]|uniref:zinc-dependent alcohol dehydrogenase family protein n=1 Tax=unclassified Pandoraea TaxID=2624094 RepID=UPI0005859B26|nr:MULTISPECIES: zinc-dependent alcohol dehydrogenase family protein [unclassified Pandoraea]OJY20814.1 MAG: alcohol dehydrogenase [Pandoraea sp. 64-18]WAL85079.1 zinc-dependent alcohol dehydrogenase family protein [Pandoraea sp. XJJ-1]